MRAVTREPKPPAYACVGNQVPSFFMCLPLRSPDVIMKGRSCLLNGSYTKCTSLNFDRNRVHSNLKAMPRLISRRWFFGFFFVSGLCSILYEIVWLRLAMAQFGVTTAMVSIVLSMFMAGLGIGSWQGGKFIPRLFYYFHPDGPELLKSERGQVIIDDGRRFLEWTPERYDLITIDPPPPVEAAGSSLLYSKEFYDLAKSKLQPDGILAQWLPGGDAVTMASVAKAIRESFPYVKAFGSLEGWGVHFIASRSPLESTTAATLSKRMPAAAASDLVEWGPFHNPEQELGAVLEREISISDITAKSPAAPALTDDRPINEYYFLRHYRQRVQNPGIH